MIEDVNEILMNNTTRYYLYWKLIKIYKDLCIESESFNGYTKLKLHTYGNGMGFITIEYINIFEKTNFPQLSIRVDLLYYDLQYIVSANVPEVMKNVVTFSDITSLKSHILRLHDKFLATL